MITQVPFNDAFDLWHHACHDNDMPGPFVCYDWHKLWYRIFQKDQEAYVLSINGTVVAPFLRIGRTVQFSGGEEIADYLDVLGEENAKFKAWEELLPFLKDNNITHIHLRNIPENSSTLSFFSNISDAEIQKEDTTPKIILPHSWKEYLASLSRKYRHELERKLRKFEREHPDTAFHQSADPATDIHPFLALMGKDSAKQKFLTTQMKTFFIEMAKEFKDQISLLLLTIGGEISAGTLSFVHNNTYYLYNSGFNRTCCQNAGFYLKAQSIRRAIELGFREYNFLQGSERYKYELGGKDFGVYTVDYTFT